MSEQQCPRADQHTPAPALYLAWHAWAQAMTNNGWRQRRCEGCRRFEVWSGTRPTIPLANYLVDCSGRR